MSTSPPPPPVAECGSDTFASSVQQVASIVFILLFIAAGAAAFYVLPKRGVNREVLDSFRVKVSQQVYYPAIIGEAIVAGFLLGYVLHLAPCFWSRCHSETDDQSNTSAILLLVLWPVTMVIIVGTRLGGLEYFSLFHLQKSAKAVATKEPADVSARLFSFNVAETVVSKA